MTATNPEGIVLTFDEYGNMIFTADEATRAILREQVNDLLEEKQKAEREYHLAEAYVKKWGAALVVDPKYLTRANDHWSHCASAANDETVFLEWIEYYLCNGYGTVSPVDIGAMWDGLLITDGSHLDNGDFDPDPTVKIWFYNHYVTRAYTEDLIERGRMRWDLAPNTEEA